jgi:MoxR-like ATPase
MLRRRVLTCSASSPCHPLLLPFIYDSYLPTNGTRATRLCGPAPSTAVGASIVYVSGATANARRSYQSLSLFSPSTPLRTSNFTPSHGATSSPGSRLTAPPEPEEQRTMSHDGVEVPCGTQLTIGDVVIPVPDFAVHPERVMWAMPGVDHSAPYLHKAEKRAHDFAKADAGQRLSLPSLQGGEEGEENMFFSVQDPLTRSYLRWIAQKEQLGQDMCLIGDPGPAMRWLVMLYSHLTRREIRVVYLNSDVTESDLKQRREIRNGSLVYDDQSAVSAAVEGQLLVLEGLERVERNVLPVVNNLLENREMHLDNGSVLIHPARYDSLLQKLYESKLQQCGSKTVSVAQRADLIADAKHELAQMGLVRVSEKFRVIGITIPVPPYDGNPLDPPLRSRFQCLYVRTPLPVVASSLSVAKAFYEQATDTHASRKRSKQVAELQERQSVRFAQVAQLRAAIAAINDSTRDFQLSKPSAKRKMQQGSFQTTGQSTGGRYRCMYDSNDVVAEMFRDEDAGTGGEGGAQSDGERSSGSTIPAASCPLQTVGHWALATIAQQLALFPDLPVGEAVMRGFPWPYYARQLTRGGTGGAAMGYANLEEYHRRLSQYAEVLQHCHVYPPLLLGADLSKSSSRSSSSSSSCRRASQPSAAKSARVGARLRTVVQGQGVGPGGDEAPDAATARSFIRSAQLVSSLDSPSADSPPRASAVPPAVQQACNYILGFRKVSTTAEFSGVPVVVAEAVVATAAHDAVHPGEAGTYPLPVFLGVAALPDDARALPSWERHVEDYLATMAFPATVFTTEHFHVLQTMLQVHASRQHMCLLGSTGCGKTAMVRAFGRLLGYEEMLTMHLYADMTNKDLFQQRTTDPETGNTTWQDSPLLHAAIYGKLVVLDGMEKLPGGMLSSLQQLLVDQSAVLADGTILKPPTEYTLLKEQLTRRNAHTGEVLWQPTDADMRERKIFPVHPAFRVVATARPPLVMSGGSSGSSASGSRGGRDFFVTHDLTTLFRIVAMPDAGEDALGPVLRQVAKAEIRVLQSETWRVIESHGGVAAKQQRSEAIVDQLMQLRSELEELHAADGKMPQLSLRQLRQLVRSAVRYPSRVEESVRNTLLFPLMTGVAATKVRHALASCGLAEATEASTPTATAAGRRGTAPGHRSDATYEVLSLDQTTVPSSADQESGSGSAQGDRVWTVNGEPVLKLSRVYKQKELALVPFVTGFHANRVHESIIAWLAKQYAMRSNILLIGNQGVGKNKVVDAFLSRLAIPRHYIQLHRDTTVGSLTINPTVEGGRVVWEDSPLVKAVQQGHCLVVDEIDKAPVEVVQVLKGLIEDREMRLGDGRQIYDPALERSAGRRNHAGGAAATTTTQRIAIHPDFRIIVLANPPGFPFHGNDFFRECGDLFAAYVMGNPDAESQLRVLTAYAPTLPRVLLERLVAVFIELQNAFTQGTLTYPFSLRELIAVVKHMSRYPQDGVFGALNNVFNFDARDENTLRLVRQVLAHYLQPMIEQGGLQRLRPYRAGQPVPLMPFKSLVTLPLHTTKTTSLQSSQPLSAVPLPAEVVADAREMVGRIASMARLRGSSAPPLWGATYPTEAFFPSPPSRTQPQQADAFTEWVVSQCTLPFLNPQTDTVLSMTALNALGDGADDEAAAVMMTLPLLSVLLLRRPNTDSTAAEGRHLIVATVRLPPSSLEAHHLVADAAEALATLWPVGYTRFVDVSAYFGEALGQDGEAGFTFTGLCMAQQRLPWIASAPPRGDDADTVFARAAGHVCAWPPSLAACAPAAALAASDHTRRSLFQKPASPNAVGGRTPQAIVLLSSSSSGTTVLLDVLAGTTSDLYRSRMSFSSARSVSHKTDNPSPSSCLDSTRDEVDTQAVPQLGAALPLPLEQLVAQTARDGHGSDPAADASSPVRLLDVSASHGVVAFTTATTTPTCHYLLSGHVVRVTLPQPVVSLKFVGDHIAVVVMKRGSAGDARSGKGLLKVWLDAEGVAQASFLPLPVGGAQQLELVEVAAGKATDALLATTTTPAAPLTPSDLAHSLWRVVSDGAARQPSQQGDAASKDGAVVAAESDDPAAPNVVYARAEGVTAEGLQLRYYKTTNDAASLLMRRTNVVVDEARHQLLGVQPDGDTVTAVDTAHGTVRSFARLPGVSASSTAVAAAAGGRGHLHIDSSSGTAYAWNGTAQQLSIADVDAERVRQRYTEWSSLLSGSAASVGDAATVEEGEEDVKDFKMKYSTPRKQPSGTLKHGEVDDKEHHGGNTWAGGTGGTDTAGLGGMVGPYRLDKGNVVYQVSPEEKRKVPKHLLEEARRMGREALKERLQSIGMTEAEYEEYKRLQERVRPAVAQLRTLLSGLKAAEGERVWVTGQTDGVWDDKKLVEGIVGEKNVYKRRVDSKESNPFQQKYKKRLVFVLDVSASMYRFNGMDQRLTKLLETTVMVMEAFAGFESKLDYAMVGHNGDSDNIPLVNFGAPPANQKERMVICQKMVAYAQYCWAGDNTVEAMRRSVELVTKEKGDAYFVFVVSDANLQRYGIAPRELTEIIQSKPEVKMFCIFIATLGAQASHLQQQLPAGHGYECMRTDALPQVMRQIFTSANLF